jgi:4-hydroxy-tetrahydrodipicolinate reductase
MEKIKILQIGMGPLGLKITEYIHERKNLEIIGAVDKDPSLIGKTLGNLCSIPDLNLTISNSIETLVRNKKPDVAVLTTVSGLGNIVPQIEEIVSHGLNVVTTCEELSYPWKTGPALAKRIDRAAKNNSVAVLSTGVNPGFLMDFFPITLSGICRKINSIKVSRIQNASFRRIPFQNKIGAGLSLSEFELKKQKGALRHVGLTESIHMIGSRMGWDIDRTEDILTPVVADKTIETENMTIEHGFAAGVQQIGKGFVKGEEKITLIFRASIGEPVSEDTIEIRGEPDIVSTIRGGINGDVATCAIVTNAAKQIVSAEPGLCTMVDIPVISCFSG